MASVASAVDVQRKVLCLSAEVFPPPYVFLKRVFNEILPEHGVHFVWVMPCTDVDAVEEVVWGSSSVFLIPKIRPSNLVGVFRDYWSHLSRVREAANKALELHGPFDAVQVRDDPTMAFVAWRLKRSLGVPFIYQLSHLKEEETILYASMGIYGGALKNRLQGRVGLTLRNYLLRQADLVFPISERMKQTLGSYSVAEERMIALPEGVDVPSDPSRWDGAAEDLRRRYELRGKRVLVYLGTMNRFRQLDFLLRVMQDVLRRRRDVRLLMVGGGREADDVSWLREVARDLGIADEVIFTGLVSREEVPAFLRLASVGLSPFTPNIVLVNNSPIKLLEYLAWEVPVVASDIPAQREVIDESGAGMCVDHKQGAFVDSIIQLLERSDTELRRLGEAGRRYLKETRDFRVLADGALRCYQTLFDERGG
jgi:glycosyltransferase involved in cell wall biosynthesis